MVLFSLVWEKQKERTRRERENGREKVFGCFVKKERKNKKESPEWKFLRKYGRIFILLLLGAAFHPSSYIPHYYLFDVRPFNDKINKFWFNKKKNKGFEKRETENSKF